MNIHIFKNSRLSQIVLTAALWRMYIRAAYGAKNLTPTTVYMLRGNEAFGWLTGLDPHLPYPTSIFISDFDSPLVTVERRLIRMSIPRFGGYYISIGDRDAADALYRKVLYAHTPGHLHQHINDSVIWPLGREIMTASYRDPSVTFSDNSGLAVTIPSNGYADDVGRVASLIDLTEEILRAEICYRICGVWS